MLRLYWLLILALAFVSTSSHAMTNGALALGVGGLSHDLNRVSQSPTGDAGALGRFHYPIVGQYMMRLSSDFYLIPYGGYSYLTPNKSTDGKVETTFLLLSLPLAYQLGNSDDSFFISFGPAFVWYTVVGSGGSKTLPNGSSTSTYAIPNSYTRTRNIALDLGFGYSLSHFKLGLNFFAEDLFSSTRRTYSVMFSTAYIFGGGR